MPIPTQDTNHVAEAQGLLTSRYANLQVVPGIVKALALRTQEIENDIFAVLNVLQLSNHPMPGGPWDILDKIGAIVGASRNGLDDADYLALIKLQARVNRSRGLSEDVLSLGAVMAAPGKPLYFDCPLAAFYLGVWDLTLNYPLFVSLLKQARPAGVYGELVYTTWADGGDFSFCSRSDATAGQAGFGSRSDVNAGGPLAACVIL